MTTPGMPQTRLAALSRRVNIARWFNRCVGGL